MNAALFMGLVLRQHVLTCNKKNAIHYYIIIKLYSLGVITICNSISTNVLENKFYVLPTVHLDIRMQWNQPDALFIFGLFSHYTSLCFGLASCPSSGGHKLYTIYIVCDNWYLLYVLVDWRRDRRESTKTYITYQLSHLYIVASCWWATSKPWNTKRYSDWINRR
jgi:type VI protein secretion system component Hcp